MPKPDIPMVPVTFAYEHRYRRVNVENVIKTKGGWWVVVGKDLDRDGAYRSFRVDRIRGKIHILVNR
ncbi:MAG: hypothetical protein ABR585_12835 [Gemmatimonadaceae bacterium]|nr:hypothetical protein [Actinomycetota bacterium]